MRNATGLASCSRALLAIHPQFRLSQLLTLLTIASRSGQTQTEIAVETGLTLSAISRAVDVLGSTGRRDKQGPAGLGLIEAVTDDSDDRLMRVSLTVKGRELLRTALGELD